MIVKSWSAVCGRTVEARAAEWARLVLMAADRASNRDMGAVIGTHYNPGRGVAAPLCRVGLAGLADGERSGRPPVYDHGDVLLLVKTATEPPPDRATRWTMDAIAPAPQRRGCRHLGLSGVAHLQVLGFQALAVRAVDDPPRPNFWERAPICVVYLDAPDRAIVWSVDEKSGSQATGRVNRLYAMKRGG